MHAPPTPIPQALQKAEADAASRAARLRETKVVEPTDWQVLLHHAVMRAPGARLAARLMDRLRMLPLSHHHRFPVCEQVCVARL